MRSGRVVVLVLVYSFCLSGQVGYGAMLGEEAREFTISDLNKQRRQLKEDLNNLALVDSLIKNHCYRDLFHAASPLQKVGLSYFETARATKITGGEFARVINNELLSLDKVKQGLTEIERQIAQELYPFGGNCQTDIRKRLGLLMAAEVLLESTSSIFAQGNAADEGADALVFDLRSKKIKPGTIKKLVSAMMLFDDKVRELKARSGDCVLKEGEAADLFTLDFQKEVSADTISAIESYRLKALQLLDSRDLLFRKRLLENETLSAWRLAEGLNDTIAIERTDFIEQLRGAYFEKRLLVHRLTGKGALDNTLDLTGVTLYKKDLDEAFPVDEAMSIEDVLKRLDTGSGREMINPIELMLQPYLSTELIELIEEKSTSTATTIFELNLDPILKGLTEFEVLLDPIEEIGVIESERFRATIVVMADTLKFSLSSDSIEVTGDYRVNLEIINKVVSDTLLDVNLPNLGSVKDRIALNGLTVQSRNIDIYKGVLNEPIVFEKLVDTFIDSYAPLFIKNDKQLRLNLKKDVLRGNKNTIEGSALKVLLEELLDFSYNQYSSRSIDLLGKEWLRSQEDKAKEALKKLATKDLVALEDDFSLSDVAGEIGLTRNALVLAIPLTTIVTNNWKKYVARDTLTMILPYDNPGNPVIRWKFDPAKPLLLAFADLPYVKVSNITYVENSIAGDLYLEFKEAQQARYLLGNVSYVKESTGEWVDFKRSEKETFSLGGFTISLSDLQYIDNEFSGTAKVTLDGYEAKLGKLFGEDIFSINGGDENVSFEIDKEGLRIRLDEDHILTKSCNDAFAKLALENRVVSILVGQGEPSFEMKDGEKRTLDELSRLVLKEKQEDLERTVSNELRETIIEEFGKAFGNQFSNVTVEGNEQSFKRGDYSIGASFRTGTEEEPVLTLSNIEANRVGNNFTFDFSSAQADLTRVQELLKGLSDSEYFILRDLEYKGDQNLGKLLFSGRLRIPYLESTEEVTGSIELKGLKTSIELEKLVFVAAAQNFIDRYGGPYVGKTFAFGSSELRLRALRIEAVENRGYELLLETDLKVSGLDDPIPFSIYIDHKFKVRSDGIKAVEGVANTLLDKLLGPVKGFLKKDFPLIGDFLKIDSTTLESGEIALGDFLINVPVGIRVYSSAKIIGLFEVSLPPVVATADNLKIDGPKAIKFIYKQKILVGPGIFLEDIGGQLSKERLAGESKLSFVDKNLVHLRNDFSVTLSGSTIVTFNGKLIVANSLEMSETEYILDTGKKEFSGTSKSGDWMKDIVRFELDLKVNWESGIEKSGKELVGKGHLTFLNELKADATFKIDEKELRFDANAKIPLPVFETNSDAHFRTDWRFDNPELSLSSDVKVGGYNVTEVRSSITPDRAKVGLKFLGVKLSTTVPSYDGLTKDMLWKLIKDLLNPDLKNLDQAVAALLQGKIEVNPASGFGRGGDGVADGGNGNSDGGEDGSNTGTSDNGDSSNKQEGEKGAKSVGREQFSGMVSRGDLPPVEIGGAFRTLVKDENGKSYPISTFDPKSNGWVLHFTKHSGSRHTAYLSGNGTLDVEYNFELVAFEDKHILSPKKYTVLTSGFTSEVLLVLEINTSNILIFNKKHSIPQVLELSNFGWSLSDRSSAKEFKKSPYYLSVICALREIEPTLTIKFENISRREDRWHLAALINILREGENGNEDDDLYYPIGISDLDSNMCFNFTSDYYNNGSKPNSRGFHLDTKEDDLSKKIKEVLNYSKSKIECRCQNIN